MSQSVPACSWEAHGPGDESSPEIAQNHLHPLAGVQMVLGEPSGTGMGTDTGHWREVLQFGRNGHNFNNGSPLMSGDVVSELTSRVTSRGRRHAPGHRSPTPAEPGSRRSRSPHSCEKYGRGLVTARCALYGLHLGIRSLSAVAFHRPAITPARTTMTAR